MNDNTDSLILSNERPGNVIIYTSDDGRIKLDVQIGGETVWLTKGQMAQLFGRDRTVVGRHIVNIYNEGELQKNITCAKFAHMGVDGDQEYNPDYYNLDVIISVGYRVHSVQGVRFRQWATGVLKEYIVKGFAMDDERLKQLGGGGYWKELLNRIRDIRTSEKVIYRQVLDIYATAVDYDPKSYKSVEFFKIVQNKLHFAAHGHTAAEVIYDRADAEQDFMGMTSFKGKWPTLRDAQVAKNYLKEEELQILNRLVSGYFDFAEVRAMRRIPTYMSDYIEQLDSVLSAGGNPLLVGSGKVSHEEAMLKAESEYRKWQENTLSPVEQAYLESIKAIEKKGK